MLSWCLDLSSENFPSKGLFMWSREVVPSRRVYLLRVYFLTKRLNENSSRTKNWLSLRNEFAEPPSTRIRQMRTEWIITINISLSLWEPTLSRNAAGYVADTWNPLGKWFAFISKGVHQQLAWRIIPFNIWMSFHNRSWPRKTGIKWCMTVCALQGNGRRCISLRWWLLVITCYSTC